MVRSDVFNTINGLPTTILYLEGDGRIVRVDEFNPSSNLARLEPIFTGRCTRLVVRRDMGIFVVGLHQVSVGKGRREELMPVVIPKGGKSRKIMTRRRLIVPSSKPCCDVLKCCKRPTSRNWARSRTETSFDPWGRVLTTLTKAITGV